MVPGVRLVVLGKQGAGKGTQCVRLARHYVVPHISTGEMFRAAVKADTPLGRQVRAFLDAGDLVPDEVVVKLVQERLERDDSLHRGFVIDGFPRTIAQAQALAEILAPDDIDCAVDLEAPTEVVLQRLAGRRVCQDCGTNYGTDSPPRQEGTCEVCGGTVVQRQDDTTTAIRRRLALYQQETQPLIAWYRDRHQLVPIDAVGTPDEVALRLIQAIDAYRAQKRMRNTDAEES
jgi:adenylate kinase